MWVASWLICILNAGCQEVAEQNPTYFFKEAECKEHAFQVAITVHTNLIMQGVSNKVGFVCALDKTIKES
jgi:hypothetical protein